MCLAFSCAPLVLPLVGPTTTPPLIWREGESIPTSVRAWRGNWLSSVLPCRGLLPGGPCRTGSLLSGRGPVVLPHCCSYRSPISDRAEGIRLLGWCPVLLGFLVRVGLRLVKRVVCGHPAPLFLRVVWGPKRSGVLPCLYAPLLDIVLVSFLRLAHPASPVNSPDRSLQRPSSISSRPSAFPTSYRSLGG